MVTRKINSCNQCSHKSFTLIWKFNPCLFLPEVQKSETTTCKIITNKYNIQLGGTRERVCIHSNSKTVLLFKVAIHKGRPQNFANFWPPPCPHVSALPDSPRPGRPHFSTKINLILYSITKLMNETWPCNKNSNRLPFTYEG